MAKHHTPLRHDCQRKSALPPGRDVVFRVSAKPQAMPQAIPDARGYRPVWSIVPDAFEPRPPHLDPVAEDSDIGVGGQQEMRNRSYLRHKVKKAAAHPSPLSSRQPERYTGRVAKGRKRRIGAGVDD